MRHAVGRGCEWRESGHNDTDSLIFDPHQAQLSDAACPPQCRARLCKKGCRDARTWRGQSCEDRPREVTKSGTPTDTQAVGEPQLLTSLRRPAQLCRRGMWPPTGRMKGRGRAWRGPESCPGLRPEVTKATRRGRGVLKQHLRTQHVANASASRSARQLWRRGMHAPLERAGEDGALTGQEAHQKESSRCRMAFSPPNGKHKVSS